MPAPKRNRRERTDEWASIQKWTLWPEQELYEQIRPLILFHETAGERAKEIDVPQRTLARKADAFEKYGLQSLFASEEHGGARESSKTLPPEICKFGNSVSGNFGNSVSRSSLRKRAGHSPMHQRFHLWNSQMYSSERSSQDASSDVLVTKEQ
jgi:hypothetical protein